MSSLLELDIWRVNGARVWPLFAPHHYLTGTFNRAARSYLATLDGAPVAFTSAIAFPHPRLQRAYRGHRTVVLPDFQGLGLGVRLSDWLGAEIRRIGGRFYSRTSHPRMIAYRNASPLWRSVAAHQNPSGPGSSLGVEWQVDQVRTATSHEYVGPADSDAVRLQLGQRLPASSRWQQG